jgi:gamma-glutamylputrescine oxidase
VALWLKYAQKKREFPRLLGRARADVAIVGGSMAGANLAYYLARDGAKVVVADADRICHRATGRNAGIVSTGMACHYNRAVKSLGRERAWEVWISTIESRSLAKSLIAHEGIVCDSAFTGTLRIATSGAEARDLAESLRLQRQDGLPGKLVGREINEILGARGFRAALYNPHDGQANSYKLVAGIASRAHDYGARFFERSPVEKVLTPGKEVVLKGPGFQVVAQNAVVCSNAYSPRLDRWFRDRIRPARGQVLATLRYPEKARPPPHLPGLVNYGYEYFRSYDRRLVAGGCRWRQMRREETYSEGVSRKVQRCIDEFVSSHFPAAPRADFRWGGTMGFSADGFPFIGPLPSRPRLYALAGFTGHGYAYSFLGAQRLARHFRGEPLEVPEFLDSGRKLGSSPEQDRILMKEIRAFRKR